MEKINTLPTTNEYDLTSLKHERPELFLPIPLRRGQRPDAPDGVPTGTVEDWRGKDDPANRIEVMDNGEPLVNIANLHPPIFAVNSYFSKLDESDYEEPLEGTTLAQYVRASVAEQLQQAQAALPADLKLVLFDGWRSLDTQYSTYELCYGSLLDRLVDEGIVETDEPLTDVTREIVSRETQKYISLPSPLPARLDPTPEQVAAGASIPSPHNTGGSVDVTIVHIDPAWQKRLDELEAAVGAIDDPFSPERAVLNFEVAAIYRLHATPLDFGTEFDFAGADAGLTYLETVPDHETARDNRRMLYHIMTDAGFMPYTDEWWHYNMGNQMAEMTKWRETGDKGVAVYGNADLDTVQRRHEALHTQLFSALVAQSMQPDRPVELSRELVEAGGSAALVADLTARVGDPRQTQYFRKSYDMRYRGALDPQFIEAIRAAQRPPAV